MTPPACRSVIANDGLKLAAQFKGGSRPIQLYPAERLPGPLEDHRVVPSRSSMTYHNQLMISGARMAVASAFRPMPIPANTPASSLT